MKKLSQDRNVITSSLISQLQRDHQEIVFPFPFINIICEVPVERHDLIFDFRFFLPDFQYFFGVVRRGF